MCKQSNTTPSSETKSKKLYPRKCDACGKGMFTGYVIGGGEEYYCSTECLHKVYTKKEWEQLYAEGTSDSYYTEWSEDDIDPDDEPIFKTNQK